MKMCGLLRCSAHVQAEVHKWGQDLANMDEARDRAVVELNRLDMVHDLILQYQGVNRREVWSFESNSELCCFNRLLQRTLLLTALLLRLFCACAWEAVQLPAVREPRSAMGTTSFFRCPVHD